MKERRDKDPWVTQAYLCLVDQAENSIIVVLWDLITSLGAGTIIYNYQTVRYVISDVDVYLAPCRFLTITKNYWSYRKNNYIFGILTKFYLRKVTSYFTCRAIRGLIFSKLPPIDWSVLRSTIWNGQWYYALRCSVKGLATL